MLLLSAIPVAMALNAVRVFLTGFATYYISPALAEGVMHLTEGWVIFVVAFGILGALAWGLLGWERRLAARPAA